MTKNKLGIPTKVCRVVVDSSRTITVDGVVRKTQEDISICEPGVNILRSLKAREVCDIINRKVMLSINVEGKETLLLSRGVEKDDTIHFDNILGNPYTIKLTDIAEKYSPFYNRILLGITPKDKFIKLNRMMYSNNFGIDMNGDILRLKEEYEDNDYMFDDIVSNGYHKQIIEGDYILDDVVSSLYIIVRDNGNDSITFYSYHKENKQIYGKYTVEIEPSSKYILYSDMILCEGITEMPVCEYYTIEDAIINICKQYPEIIADVMNGEILTDQYQTEFHIYLSDKFGVIEIARLEIGNSDTWITREVELDKETYIKVLSNLI